MAHGFRLPARLPLVVAIALCALCGACSRTETAAGASPGSASAAVAFANLRDLDVVSGTVVVRVQPAPRGRVLLVAGGVVVASTAAPGVGLTWDSTRGPDGLVGLELREQPRGGSPLARTRVVVVNRGAEVFFSDGSGGKISVPPSGYEPQHLRYHFRMSDGAKRMLAILTWERPGVELELAAGLGQCPHHGTTLARQTSARSPIVLDLAVPPDAPPERWFCHVRLTNAERVLGTETPFSVRAFTFR